MNQTSLIFSMPEKKIEERERDFKKYVWEVLAGKDERLIPVCVEFVDYWGEYDPTKKNPKMLWEIVRDRPKSVWHPQRRFARFVRNAKPAKTNKVTHPNWFDKKYASGLSSEEYQDYKKHLISKGFSFGGGASGGSFVRKPNGEMIWL